MVDIRVVSFIVMITTSTIVVTTSSSISIITTVSSNQGSIRKRCFWGFRGLAAHPCLAVLGSYFDKIKLSRFIKGGCSENRA